MSTGASRLRHLWRWPPPDLKLLALALVATAALSVFLLVASAVTEGETLGIDEAILRALRHSDDLSQPIGPHWLALAMRDVTSLGGVTLLTLITLCVLAYLILIGDRRTAWLVFLAIAGGALMSTGLKNLFGRPRPDLVAHLVDVETLSFPSGHATLSAITYLTLGTLLGKAQTSRAARLYFIALAVMLTGLIGVSRVYLGVHWPSDVLAGWAVGITWALIWRIVGTLLTEGPSITPAAIPKDKAPIPAASRSGSCDMQSGS